jgi:3-phenylpropionate/cinnamic acid dioxygenase small subunit
VTTPTLDQTARSDISDVLIRYATGIDRRDWELFRTCFTDDCVADYGDIGTWHGVDEIAAWMIDVHEPAGYTLHRITNQAVVPTASGAAVSSYVDAVLMGADNVSGVRAVGFYDDAFVQTKDGWQIRDRRFTAVYFEIVNPGGRA